jgi:hypothetical protein
MRPSDKVWNGISKQLKRRRRIFGYLLAISVMITSGIGYWLLDKTEPVAVLNPVDSETKNQPGVSVKTPGIDPAANGIRTTPVSRIRAIPANEGSVQASPANLYTGETSLFTKGTPDKPAEPGLISPVDQRTGDKTSAYQPGTVDSYFEEYAVNSSPAETPARLQATDPLTIESIINSFQKKDRRFGLQLHFTPTISYRNLSDNHIDHVVTHKPYFGFELGLTSKYTLNRSVKLRGGLQFNVNRYGIKTNRASTELATIRLSSNNGMDSVNTITNYNNFEGYEADWLQNFYFQVSAPVGIELRLRGDEKMHLGIASTIQPTYLIGDRAYLISSDYKNYAEVPRLIRRWNLNTSLETFVAYSTGKLKWQVGPQVRYQLLSSFDKTYPVKENLFDFGLKVGISLKQK